MLIAITVFSKIILLLESRNIVGQKFNSPSWCTHFFHPKCSECYLKPCLYFVSSGLIWKASKWGDAWTFHLDGVVRGMHRESTVCQQSQQDAIFPGFLLHSIYSFSYTGKVVRVVCARARYRITIYRCIDTLATRYISYHSF